ncbi:unnamed protein product [Linum trigynum]|uniref:Uncharacterized protein n=1 Tax=Linum trigynum TaxID=586398 RepID=A0AAV2G3D1_9ROSI
MMGIFTARRSAPGQGSSGSPRNCSVMANNVIESKGRGTASTVSHGEANNPKEGIIQICQYTMKTSTLTSSFVSPSKSESPAEAAEMKPEGRKDCRRRKGEARDS